MAERNTITRRSVLAMFAGLAGAACYPFAGVADEIEQPGSEPGKWTVAFGKAKPMSLLQISSAAEPIDKPAIATMTVKVGGEFFEPDMVFHEMDVTVRLDEKPYVVRDALCTGMRVVRLYDDPSYTQVFMQP